MKLSNETKSIIWFFTWMFFVYAVKEIAGEKYAYWAIGFSVLFVISREFNSISQKLYEQEEKINRLERYTIKKYTPIEDFTHDKNQEGDNIYEYGNTYIVSGYKIDVHFELNVPAIVKKEIKILSKFGNNEILEKIYTAKNEEDNFGFERKLGRFVYFSDEISQQKLIWSDNQCGIPNDSYYKIFEIMSDELCLKAFGEKSPQPFTVEIDNGDLSCGRRQYCGNNREFGYFPLLRFVKFLEKNYIYAENTISKFPFMDNGDLFAKFGDELKRSGFEYEPHNENNPWQNKNNENEIVTHGNADFFRHKTVQFHKFTGEFLTIYIKANFSFINA